MVTWSTTFKLFFGYYFGFWIIEYVWISIGEATFNWNAVNWYGVVKKQRNYSSKILKVLSHGYVGLIYWATSRYESDTRKTNTFKESKFNGSKCCQIFH